MTKALEERFVKIVTEMDAELAAAQTKIVLLESKMRVLNFPNEQATTCGKCGVYKHTTLLNDEGYGYVCATCLVEINEERIKEVKDILRAAMDDAKETHKQPFIKGWFSEADRLLNPPGDDT